MHDLVMLILDNALADDYALSFLAGKSLFFWGDVDTQGVSSFYWEMYTPVVESEHGNYRSIIDASQALQPAGNCEH